MQESYFDMELEEKFKKSVERLLCADVLDITAYQNFIDSLWEKASQIQQEPVISKQILSYLLSASSALESRSEYIPEVREHAKPLLEELALLLSALATGETREDRKSGVPKIY